MKHRLLAVFVPIAFVAVAATWWFWWPVYQLELKVKSGLTDPDSARFSNVRFIRATGAGCGFVNSKNQMGGYAGDTEFVVPAEGGVLFAPRAGDRPTAEEKVDNLMAAIEFLDLVVKHCPES